MLFVFAAGVYIEMKQTGYRQSKEVNMINRTCGSWLSDASISLEMVWTSVIKIKEEWMPFGFMLNAGFTADERFWSVPWKATMLADEN